MVDKYFNTKYGMVRQMGNWYYQDNKSPIYIYTPEGEEVKKNIMRYERIEKLEKINNK